MKTLFEMICEGTGLPTINKKQVFDYYGDEWTLEAICRIDNKVCVKCKDLDDLLHRYDRSGAMSDAFEEMDFADTDYVVGVSSKEHGKAAFIWGEDGVSYK